MRKEICDYVACRLHTCDFLKDPCFTKFNEHEVACQHCQNQTCCYLQQQIEIVKKQSVESLVPFLVSEIGVLRLEAKKQYTLKRSQNVLS